MRIAIDIKNQALFGGGIAHWAAEVLPAWFEKYPANDYVLVTPRGIDVKPVTNPGVGIAEIPWPSALPRSFRHPIYDNWSFPRTVRNLRPDFVFSPYHDVRMPRDIPSVITVHDLCYLDVAECYPWHLRNYYVGMLRINLKRAQHVITVSQATRDRLMVALGLPGTRISIVPNALDQAFVASDPDQDSIANWRRSHGAGQDGNSLLLYPGGIEYRKNLVGLMAALRQLWNDGERISLLITGELASCWRPLFPELTTNPDRVAFLGRLSASQLRLAYEAVDAVVYPSLCEGFGRVCVEAMAIGSPLACSDLAVLREVAGDYPCYFDPKDTDSMARAIRKVLSAGRQTARIDPRFTPDAVRLAFLEAVAPIVSRINKERAK